MDTDTLKSLAISDTGFIFDPATGASFSATPTGIDVIRFLKSGKSVGEIIDIFQECYEVSRDVLESDVRDFIRSLEEQYLV